MWMKSDEVVYSLVCLSADEVHGARCKKRQIRVYL